MDNRFITALCATIAFTIACILESKEIIPSSIIYILLPITILLIAGIVRITINI